jgi:hypothetical protein
MLGPPGRLPGSLLLPPAQDSLSSVFSVPINEWLRQGMTVPLGEEDPRHPA